MEPVEVIKWQALDKWMYHKAVSRVQTRIKIEKRVFFLRRGGSIINEVRFPSNKCQERHQDFEIGNWIYTRVGQDIFFVRNESKQCGFLQNDGHSKFKIEKKSDLL